MQQEVRFGLGLIIGNRRGGFYNIQVHEGLVDNNITFSGSCCVSG